MATVVEKDNSTNLDKQALLEKARKIDSGGQMRLSDKDIDVRVRHELNLEGLLPKKQESHKDLSLTDLKPPPKPK